MVECSFCGAEVKKASGKMFVRNNGQVLHFCKSKCEKNMLVLKRDSRKFKWTKFFEKGESPVESQKSTKKAPKKEAKVETKTEKKTVKSKSKKE